MDKIKYMELSIIILNYNTKKLLQQCLEGLKSLQLPYGYEIIVVDNASKDGSVEFLLALEKQISGLKVILNKKNLGYAAGNNQGIKISSGKYLLILNPDVVVHGDSIIKLCQFMETYQDAAICGPKLLNPDRSIQFSCRKFPKWYTPILRRTPLGIFAKKALRDYLMIDYDHSQARPVDWLLGACLLARRQAMDKVGLMDEKFFLYFEDIDWCRRFHQSGWQVYYVPEAEMVHFHQRLSAGHIFSPAGRAHIASWIKYLWKWKGRGLPNP